MLEARSKETETEAEEAVSLRGYRQVPTTFFTFRAKHNHPEDFRLLKCPTP